MSFSPFDELFLLWLLAAIFVLLLLLLLLLFVCVCVCVCVCVSFFFLMVLFCISFSELPVVFWSCTFNIFVTLGERGAWTCYIIFFFSQLCVCIVCCIVLWMVLIRLLGFSCPEWLKGNWMPGGWIMNAIVGLKCCLIILQGASCVADTDCGVGV